MFHNVLEISFHLTMSPLCPIVCCAGTRSGVTRGQCGDTSQWSVCYHQGRANSHHYIAVLWIVRTGAQSAEGVAQTCWRYSVFICCAPLPPDWHLVPSQLGTGTAAAPGTPEPQILFRSISTIFPPEQTESDSATTI